MNTPTPHIRHIQSFVRREGRLTESQEEALTTLFPIYGVEKSEDLLQIPELFGQDPLSTNMPLAIEIGFGNGDHLLNLALNRPDWSFLGFEVYRPGAGRLLRHLKDSQASNVRVSLEDAQAFIPNRLPANSIDLAIIQFPDPWPKKRHHKRRLVQESFILTLFEKLKKGGEIQLATDWEPYAQHMLATLDAIDGLTNKAGKGKFSPRPENRIATKFEKRGVRLGHQVFDLVYQKQS